MAEEPNQWRSKTTTPESSVDDMKLRRLIRDAKFPKDNMLMKEKLLNEIHLIQRFNCMKETVKHARVLKKKRLFGLKSCKRNPLRMQDQHNMKIAELVTEIKSSKFKISEDGKTDFDIARGVSTMSCFDKVPREPVVDMSDANNCDSRPNVTEALEQINIECDWYNMNEGAHNNVPPTDLLQQTVSWNINANPQNHADSELPITDPHSITQSGCSSISSSHT